MGIRPANRMQMPAAEIIKTRNSPSALHERVASPQVSRIKTNLNEKRLGYTETDLQVPREFFQDNNARFRKEAPLLSSDFLEESLKILQLKVNKLLA